MWLGLLTLDCKGGESIAYLTSEKISYSSRGGWEIMTQQTKQPAIKALPKKKGCLNCVVGAFDSEELSEKISYSGSEHFKRSYNPMIPSEEMLPKCVLPTSSIDMLRTRERALQNIQTKQLKHSCHQWERPSPQKVDYTC